MLTEHTLLAEFGMLAEYGMLVDCRMLAEFGMLAEHGMLLECKELPELLAETRSPLSTTSCRDNGTRDGRELGAADVLPMTLGSYNRG